MIMREGPLTVALQSAHHEGAETEVQHEDRLIPQRVKPMKMLIICSKGVLSGVTIR